MVAKTVDGKHGVKGLKGLARNVMWGLGAGI